MHGSKQKKECPTCLSMINLPNYGRHINSCNGTGTWAQKERRRKVEIEGKTFHCDQCEKVFTTIQGLNGHEQRSHRDRNKQIEYSQKGKARQKEMRDNGYVFPVCCHTDETKDHLSKLACTRLAKHSKYSKNVEYKPGVILESSYEVRVAEILDRLRIEWIKVRQGYKWNDNGKMRRYIPDFYLPSLDLFLDPKNDYLITKDKAKIDSAMALNNIRVIVLSNKEINDKSIRTMLL